LLASSRLGSFLALLGVAVRRRRGVGVARGALGGPLGAFGGLLLFERERVARRLRTHDEPEHDADDQHRRDEDEVRRRRNAQRQRRDHLRSTPALATLRFNSSSSLLIRPSPRATAST